MLYLYGELDGVLDRSKERPSSVSPLVNFNMFTNSQRGIGSRPFSTWDAGCCAPNQSAFKKKEKMFLYSEVNVSF